MNGCMKIESTIFFPLFILLSFFDFPQNSFHHFKLFLCTLIKKKRRWIQINDSVIRLALQGSSFLFPSWFFSSSIFFVLKFDPDREHFLLVFLPNQYLFLALIVFTQQFTEGEREREEKKERGRDKTEHFHHLTFRSLSFSPDELFSFSFVCFQLESSCIVQRIFSRSVCFLMSIHSDQFHSLSSCVDKHRKELVQTCAAFVGYRMNE